MVLFIQPRHGVTAILLTYEFASRRFSICFHSILYVQKEDIRVRKITEDGIDNHGDEYNFEFKPDHSPSPSSRIDLLLTNTSTDIYNIFCKLDEFINTMFVPTISTDVNSTSLNHKNKGFEMRV